MRVSYAVMHNRYDPLLYVMFAGLFLLLGYEAVQWVRYRVGVWRNERLSRRGFPVLQKDQERQETK